jgi:hypothetical protein
LIRLDRDDKYQYRDVVARFDRPRDVNNERKKEMMKVALLILATTYPSIALGAETCVETKDGIVCVELGSQPDESREEKPQCKDLRGTRVCIA